MTCCIQEKCMYGIALYYGIVLWYGIECIVWYQMYGTAWHGTMKSLRKSLETGCKTMGGKTMGCHTMGDKTIGCKAIEGKTVLGRTVKKIQEEKTMADGKTMGCK